ncbi:DNA topology modulation protein [Paenibacillus baekrokdamisoli]|uniref:DNA topology modulation protein n=1 Tax=Paenibacillus baekrokdamisoli TaxID=1712516 RepID=A0A3G9J6I9_9BACL|nr:AAA family ATPase [Paenibacillus baekrokdamisoli]MBB3073483.1 adenylate kinase family enzyme [Paenibacillus baekrokdamisoli]BBH20443.1 DNA topology modulation protein [Paenibacillus baekrokdamisoli]
MRKILITGIVASGKTTLAKQLSNSLNIPCYELDSIVHPQTNEGRKSRTPEEQVSVIEEIDRNGQWIFEGTNRESYRCLFDMADIILFLDPPLWKRKMRIFTRFLKQNLGIEKCNYKSDFMMLKMMYKWTREFEKNRMDFEDRIINFEDKLIRLTDNINLEKLVKRF